MSECWGNLTNYPGYQVSDQGHVRSLDRTIIARNGRTMRFKGRLLKQCPNQDGYLQVNLRSCGDTWPKLVHLLVAEIFHGTALGREVHHLNRIRWDNRAVNLAYEAGQVHLSKHFTGEANPASKLTELQVMQIQEMLANGMSQRAIARRFQVQQSTISRINTQQRWCHLRNRRIKRWQPSFDDLQLELALDFTLDELPELAF